MHVHTRTLLWLSVLTTNILLHLKIMKDYGGILYNFSRLISYHSDGPVVCIHVITVVRC